MWENVPWKLVAILSQLAIEHWYGATFSPNQAMQPTAPLRYAFDVDLS
jgi:hypothetical protein